ncbi:MAG: NAD-dependent protein deacylase [Oscillospiraceae bacterium]|nr:NAD-dependent protein deacylase [Oscillospiraceae bacterium]
MSDPAATLRQWIEESENIVFFGGAGVSTESGIPDFRSVDGLYNQKYSEPPEEIISHSYFLRWPEKFYRFYKEKMLYPQAEPNDCHKALAKLEAEGKLKCVLTQNIDGLHQKAGSRKVIELHGTTLKNYCMSCGRSFSVEYVLEAEGVPRCDKCGGIVKPDVVLYEESLHDGDMEEAVRYIRKADMFIVGGTSLTVYPAAGLVDYYRGKRLVLINKSTTPYDSYADLVIHDSIGKVFRQCVSL